MPDCQSGAVHSLGCGTIIGSADAGDVGVCHADCHAGSCRNASYCVGCSKGRSARLFPGKETGAGWRKHNGQWDRWLQNSCAGMCCRNGHGVKWAFITRASDRASFRTLIALGQNHRGSGVALKVLATWVCCQRQRFAASFYRSRMTGSTALRAVACASQRVLEALGREWCRMDDLPSVVF